MEKKFCTHCHTNKDITEWGRNIHRPDYLSLWCKACMNESSRLYRLRNLNACRTYEQQYQVEHRASSRAIERKWYATHREVVCAAKRQWRAANPIKVRTSVKQWKITNPDKLKVIRKRYSAKRNATIMGNLTSRIGPPMRKSLRGNKGGLHWEKLVGYTVYDLKDHIEKLFTIDMTWEHFMAGEIHIDHKIPIAAFNFETPSDLGFKECWALKNLQPLWKMDNIMKADKIDQSCSSIRPSI